MSKGLEKLKTIRHIHDMECGEDERINKDFDIIEKELKEYEMEHTLRVRLENINYELVREKQENEKKLKALEIIKNKDVSMYWLRHSKSANDYNNFILTDKRQYQKLTEEEFDLLKEVLS